MLLDKYLKERILIFDGAMGTMLQSWDLKEKDFRKDFFENHPVPLQGNNDVLSMTRPDVVQAIHQKYLASGADIIGTNSFSANSISQADYGLESAVYEINLHAARLAKEIAVQYTNKTPDKPRFVTGSIGPTTRVASISPDVNRPEYRNIHFDQLKAAFYEQISALIEGGVDLLLFETITDTLNCKAGIYAAQQYFSKHQCQIPIMISGTITDASGRTLTGQTTSAFYSSLAHAQPQSLGFNCALGASDLRPYIKELSDISPFPICVYPNAGLPNEFGQYDQTPEEMVEIIEDFAKSGILNIVGGCCGTTDKHIQAISKAVQKYPPRKIPTKESITLLSGLEQLKLSPEIRFVNVGERTNVAGSKKFKRLIQEKKYDEALTIAREQVENGALMIDINMDDGLIDGVHEMTTFLNLIATEPEISRVPIMIDSSDWEIIIAGLKCIQGKSSRQFYFS